MYTTIKTSQRTFVTDPERWLSQSIYFDNLFSGKWGDKQEDGSYFIETDAHIFEHILRHLRTGVLPVFYDRLAGHDFPLYQALLDESMYFAIDRLQKWLCERKYLDAVKIHYIATETHDREAYRRFTTSTPDGRTFMEEDRFIEITTSSNMETTIVPVTQQRNSFYCPDAKHGKSSEEHCRSCFGRARDDGKIGYGGWRNEDQLKWCIVRKEVVFNHDLCVNAFLGDS
ncbi:hypothetical protein NA57DRAFT_77452 [Rhizodiscina lignyota]|uniref:Potassium channel tetramerisation-type BTB domain-containing protein n=1 Tax=Rhizodiscina lignyota TaxID=1504668 RepID=A0A9P4IAN1_9PEZI|nr:hypothetical protein NA57DRAFT_77452 [Rhizodiscina lignyota]